LRFCSVSSDEKRKHGYSYLEGLTMMAANAVGIDPYLAAEAGEDATPSLRALRHALSLPPGPEQQNALAAAAREMGSIDSTRHGALVTAITDKIAAAGGQSRDARRNPRTSQQRFVFAKSRSSLFPNPTVTPSIHSQLPAPGRFSDSIDQASRSSIHPQGLKREHVATIRLESGEEGGEEKPGEPSQETPDQEKVRFTEANIALLDSELAQMDREYLVGLKLELERARYRLNLAEVVIDVAGGVMIAALLSGQIPVATFAGLATVGAYGGIHIFGWFLDDAIARIDQAVAQKR
jgi:hypothetical protein